ncbi:MAG: N-acetyl-gamma-glutamyl-phosphate reductase [Deltaproteobacteria bacterium]|jgi:N-acetyl-gamma-glutamyl-phosphate reductase|nr:N-acetyl-gamma-glutamyl-phosphate reductase [Deltaproteobacteria bacterium]
MRIGVIGASGYAGLELLRLLAGRSGDEVVLITSRQEAGQKLTELFPALAGLANYDQLRFVEPAALAGQADVFLLAAQHGAAMVLVPELLAAGAKVVDLSADFRLRSPEEFALWYGLPHAAPELLAQAVYGLPELYAEKIKKAALTANPGCYPTSVILALAPVLKARLLDPSQVPVADAKSGVTGAGRGAVLSNAFCEVQDNFKSYKTVGHRHTPEMLQELSTLWGQQVKLAFTPHLLPINRGILATVYVKLAPPPSLEALRGLFLDFYREARFVRVRPLGQSPETADVRGTNFCDLALFHDRASGLFKIVSVIDNLCRGAAGQAVANLNLMTGRPEEHGLLLPAVRP